jgi:hypothetical protein
MDSGIRLAPHDSITTNRVFIWGMLVPLDRLKLPTSTVEKNAATMRVILDLPCDFRFAIERV